MMMKLLSPVARSIIAASSLAVLAGCAANGVGSPDAVAKTGECPPADLNAPGPHQIEILVIKNDADTKAESRDGQTKVKHHAKVTVTIERAPSRKPPLKAVVSKVEDVD